MSAFVKTLMVGTILASGVSLAAARGVGGVGGVAAGASSNTSANAGCDASDASDRTGHASPDAGCDASDASDASGGSKGDAAGQDGSNHEGLEQRRHVYLLCSSTLACIGTPAT